MPESGKALRRERQVNDTRSVTKLIGHVVEFEGFPERKICGQRLLAARWATKLLD